MKSTNKIIPEGTLITINNRDVEYLLKCSLSYEFEKRLHKDLNLKLYKSLDVTFSYAAFKLLLETMPSKSSLIHQLKTNMMDSYHTEEEVDAIIDKKGSRIISNFSQMIQGLSRSYSPRVGPYVSETTFYGTNIQIPVPLIITNNNSISKTKFLLIDYSSQDSVNIFGRLWALCISEDLLEKGQANSEIGVININKSKSKVFYPTTSSKSIGQRIIQSICITVASNLVIPTYSNRCSGCPYTMECSKAVTF